MMKFYCENEGELSRTEVLRRVRASIEEMRSNLQQALVFEFLLDNLRLMDGDRFLDHTAVMEHGYDRTGLNELVAREE